MDKNLAEPDVAKKIIADNKGFFNCMNKSDSKKEDVWSPNARNGMKVEAAPNLE